MINAYLTDNATLIYVTRDASGRTTAELKVVVPARIVRKARRVLNGVGEEVQSEVSFMAQDRALGLADFVEIDAHRRAILVIRRPRDFSWGFMEVVLGGRL